MVDESELLAAAREALALILFVAGLWCALVLAAALMP